MKYVKRFFLLLILCLLVVFFFQNFQTASHVFWIDFGFYSYKLSAPVYNAGILGASFILGMFVFFLFSASWGHSARSELRRSRKTVKKLEEKVGKLEVELHQSKSPAYEEQPSRQQELFRAPK